MQLASPEAAESQVGQELAVATVADAHAAGLTVIGWTFRRENSFLPADFRKGTDPAAAGDLEAEIRTFLAAGMDGYFTDNPDIGSELDLDLT